MNCLIYTLALNKMRDSFIQNSQFIH